MTTFLAFDLGAESGRAVAGQLDERGLHLTPIRRFPNGPVRLLDVCFGLGYNTFAAVDTVSGVEGGMLDVTALEMDRRVVAAASACNIGRSGDLVSRRDALRAIHDVGRYENDRVRIEMHWRDARFTCRRLEAGGYDAIFLDPFSTQRNSELWTVDFFGSLRELLKPDGVLVTYSAAIPVRSGLLEAGFCVGETPAVGRQRGGTIAALDPKQIQHPPHHKIHMKKSFIMIISCFLIHRLNKGFHQLGLDDIFYLH